MWECRWEWHQFTLFFYCCTCSCSGYERWVKKRLTYFTYFHPTHCHFISTDTQLPKCTSRYSYGLFGMFTKWVRAISTTACCWFKGNSLKLILPAIKLNFHINQTADTLHSSARDKPASHPTLYPQLPACCCSELWGGDVIGCNVSFLWIRLVIDLVKDWKKPHSKNIFIVMLSFFFQRPMPWHYTCKILRILYRLFKCFLSMQWTEKHWNVTLSYFQNEPDLS